MAVQTQIGFFQDIVDSTQLFAQSHDVAIKPIIPANLAAVEGAPLRVRLGLNDSLDANDVMHWGFHQWGDVDNVVGA